MVRTLFSIRSFVVVFLATASAVQAKEPLTAKGVEFFESKIRPILSSRCYSCHSEKSKEVKGGLKLDTREGIRAGGESGPAVVPNNLEDSLLIQAIHHETYEMPPGDKLPDNVIQDFEDWIAMGAPDPRSKSDAGKKLSLSEARKYWAFQLPKKLDSPEPHISGWAYNEIDRWVAAGWNKKQLTPVGDADRATLIRRATFDLIGLPPTIEEVEAFVADPAPTKEAFAKVIDGLLDRPQFGERWGRHWLDVARFGESAGKERNVPYPFAWRYRNWVIDAFNADKPYDKFVREQLAGDLMPSKSDEEHNANLIATGFLAIGTKGLNERNREQYKFDVVDDQIDATTRAFLGMTVACARCHDHKFDPISTNDYYALAGIFCSTEVLAGVEPGRPMEGFDGEFAYLKNKDHKPAPKHVLTKEEEEKIATLEREITQFKQRLKGLEFVSKNPGVLNQKSGPGPKGKGKGKGPLPKQIEKMKERMKLDPNNPEQSKQVVSQAQGRINQQIEEKTREIEKLKHPANFDGEKAMAVRDRATPENAQVRVRGEVRERGDTIPRGIPAVMAIHRNPKFDATGSGRPQLAAWIAAKDNPLTARVAVNRMWMHLFGKGIVESSDNFGVLAEAPSHPELLDYLALRFMEQGWSHKTMIREIMLSHVYQLSSAHDERNFGIDGDNTYLWRMSRRRLEAEAIRDSILAVAGRIDLKRPETSEVQKLAESGMMQKMMQAMRERRGGGFNPDQQTYRSVYLPLMRSRVPEQLAVFDMVDPSLISGQREVTTVAPQALFLMNSNFVAINAGAAAKRVTAMGKTREERIDAAFMVILQRKPNDDERRSALDFMKQYVDLVDKNGQPGVAQNAAWTSLCQALIATGEFRYVY